MRAQAQQDVIQLFVLRNHHTAFHGGHVVTKERTVGTHKPEGPCLPPLKFRTERLAVVFNQDDVPLADNAFDRPKIIRIA